MIDLFLNHEKEYNLECLRNKLTNTNKVFPNISIISQYFYSWGGEFVHNLPVSSILVSLR